MTRCNALLLTGLLALAALPASAQTVLTVAEDAYVQTGADADVAKGTTDPNRLWIRTASSLTRYTYLKFDLASLAGNVQRAVLRVTVDTAPAADMVDRMDAVGAASDSWAEATITANNAPAVGDPNVFVASVVVARQTSTDPDVTYEFDVTPLVQTEYAGDKVVTIVLTDLTMTAGVDTRLYSKESGTPAASNQPQLVVTTTTVASEDGPEARSFAVTDVGPNPFGAQATMRYDLATAGDFSVDAFNVLGRRVAVLHEGAAPAGAGSVVWDGTSSNGSRLAAGVYVVRFRFDGEVVTRRLTLTR